MPQGLPRQRFVTVVIILALTIQVAAQIGGPTTGAPQGPRTGMIVGQVIDATTGAPIPEAVVQLNLRGNPAPSATPPGGRVMADDDGRFFFADLPAGDYYLGITKDGYARAEHGQRQAWGAGQLLTLGEGERRADVRLRMWKYAVIAGRVVDEAGEPVIGVAVRALIKNVVAGRIGFGNLELIPELVPIATTDDRGMFRLTQLQPGTYVVLVPSSHASVPVSVMTGMDPYALRLELFWAGVTETSTLGQPRVQQAGDAALFSMSSVAIPPSPTSGRQMIYRTTYHPAVTTAAAATQIPLAAGEERTDITIALRPAPSVRVSGRVVTPDGSAPSPMSIKLIGEAMADVITRGLPQGTNDTGFQTATALIDAAGRFTLLGVPPGDYVIQHGSRFLSRALQQGLPAYWISQRLAVGTEDIQDLVVQARPAVRVEGRIEFRGAAQPTSALPASIRGVTFETPFGELGQFSVEINRETMRTFATVAAGGQYIVRPFASGGLVLQSVMAGDRDVTDRAFDLQSDTSFVVTYTDRPSKVTGSVQDARGAPSATAMVLAFPVDRQRWSGYGQSPRDIGSARTTGAGVYTFAHLPPGDYYLVAIDAAESDGWRDPTILEALSHRATRLTIGAGDPAKTVNLTAVSAR